MDDLRIMTNKELLIEKSNARDDFIDAQEDVSIHISLAPDATIHSHDVYIVLCQDWNDIYDKLITYRDAAEAYYEKTLREVKRRDALRQTKRQVDALGGKVTWLETLWLHKNAPETLTKSGRLL